MSGDTAEYKGIPKLTAVTYAAWKRAVTMALMSERCIDIVERNENEPEPPLPLPEDADPDDVREYNKAYEKYQDRWENYRARYGRAGWLLNQSLTKESETYVKDTTDPAEMWDILKTKMDSKDNSVLQRTIRRDFQDIRHDGKEPIEEYIRKLREFQRALEGTPDAINDRAIMSKILLSLPAAWETKIAAIEDDDSLTLDKLERVLRNYQSRINAAKSHDVALATRGRGNHRGRGRGNYRDRVQGSRVSKDTECWHCLQKGHMQSSCPLRAEREKRQKERKEARDKANVVPKVEEVDSEKEMSFMVKHYYDEEPETEWVLDSGATGHMCCDRKAFETLKRLPNAKVIYLGDGSEVGAYGIGTVLLNSTIPLKEVLYVPDFTVNLVSIRMLDKDGYEFRIKDSKCTILKDGEEVIRSIGTGLYTLQVKEDPNMALRADILKGETEELWHRRLGHLNLASVKSLESMAVGYHIVKGPKETKVCLPCLEGKQHKVYNRHEPSKRMAERLEMIHSDTCGPFRTPSKAGAKTFALFIDDKTRMVWCHFMKSKTETPEAFKSFKALVEKHSGKAIKRFRCDNGKAEYDNATFQSLLRESGISYEPAAPYTQNQNGVSERMNRTIMEKARSMLLEARLPESFWAEAVNTAVYLHNRSPTRSLEGVTPYEAWNGFRPDLSNLRVFGCDAYLFVPDEKRGKLQPKSQKCVHMGYVWNTTKMWRLWDPSGRRVVIGSNVRFDESSLGGREAPVVTYQDEDKNIPEDVDTPDKMRNDILGAIDDSSKGRLATGMPPEVVNDDDKPSPENATVVSKETEIESTPIGPESATDENPEAPRRSSRIRSQTKPFPGMRAFAARVGKDGEPVTLREALQEEPIKWREAIADEFKSHQENGTWVPAKLPAGKKGISTKWVFKFKTNADGSRRYKARLVVRGYEQRAGIDFEETFAPVAKFTTVRVMLALATHFDWEIHQMDVKTAFLYPEIEEEVYITIPEGYDEFHPDTRVSGGVFRLVKTLYGLRQSPLAWFKVLDRLFRSKGLHRSNEDPSLYISKDLILLIFVDDIVFFAQDMKRIEEAKAWLTREFKMVDLGDLKLFLGMQITRNRPQRTLLIDQERYVQKVLERCQMESCNGCIIPMDTKLSLSKPDQEKVAGIQEYQSLVGSIMYAMLGTRPDLAYAISTLSKFNSCPAEEHHAAAKRVLRYLQKTKDHGLLFKGLEDPGFPEVIGYTDSDWAGNLETRRSTGGYVFILGNAAVSWKTKRQSMASLSSTEAEYVALSEATKEAMWLRRLLREIETRNVPREEVNLAKYHEDEINRQWKLWEEDNWEELQTEDKAVSSRPQKIKADNQGCIKLAENVLGGSRAKHIEIRYHYVRDMLGQGKIELLYEPTATMTADVLTKALPRDRHWIHTKNMGVIAKGHTGQVGV